MKGSLRNISYFLLMAGLIVLVGQLQSWNLALSILNLCPVSYTHLTLPTIYSV